MKKWLRKIFGRKAKSKKISKNLTEALDALDRLLSDSDKTIMQFFWTAEDTCVHLHHSLGRQLRNDWGLWETKKSPLYQWFKSQGVWHADDMSSIIILSYCRKIKGQPIKLQEQIQKYIEYWNAMEKV